MYLNFCCFHHYFNRALLGYWVLGCLSGCFLRFFIFCLNIFLLIFFLSEHVFKHYFYRTLLVFRVFGIQGGHLSFGILKIYIDLFNVFEILLFSTFFSIYFVVFILFHSRTPLILFLGFLGSLEILIF